jgi:hypothetical protein
MEKRTVTARQYHCANSKFLTSSYPKISIRGTVDNLLIVASWCSTTDSTPLSLTGDKKLKIYALCEDIKKIFEKKLLIVEDENSVDVSENMCEVCHTS